MRGIASRPLKHNDLSDQHAVNIGCYYEVPGSTAAFPEKLGDFTNQHNASLACAKLTLQKNYQV